MRSLIATLCGWLRFKPFGGGSGSKAPPAISRERSGESIALRYPPGADLPAGLPTPRDLRVLVAHLRRTVPPAEALGLVKAKRYELIHELAGYHDALDAIDAIAEALEQAEAEAQLSESVVA